MSGTPTSTSWRAMSKDQPKDGGKMVISMIKDNQKLELVRQDSNKNDFKFLIQIYNQEVEETQYIPIPMVRPFITQ